MLVSVPDTSLSAWMEEKVKIRIGTRKIRIGTRKIRIHPL